MNKLLLFKGASTAGDLYIRMLKRCSPVIVQTDVVFPADDNYKQPDLSKVCLGFSLFYLFINKFCFPLLYV